MKKFAGDIIILDKCTKNHNHVMYGSWDTEWDRQKKSVILDHFLPFCLPPPMISNIKILKKMQKLPGDIILLYIHVHHKWRSSDMWFLKYKKQHTEIFNILGQFLPFLPLDNLENQNFNIEKKSWRYHFTYLHHKWQLYDVWFLRYILSCMCAKILAYNFGIHFCKYQKAYIRRNTFYLVIFLIIFPKLVLV